MERQLTDAVMRDLEKKMVFLVGPRQCGKTWLAKQIATRFNNPVYLNYDNFEDKQIIKNGEWKRNSDLLILDEIHKMPEWKNYLKGIFDTKDKKMRILVTGSARLDTFRSGGDSMAGRFFVHHLMPFSVLEAKNAGFSEPLSRLLERGGFPEAFLSDNINDVYRWRRYYNDSLIRQDVLDFQRVLDIRAIADLTELLRLRVGSPVSYRSLSEDLSVSPNTVKKYISILEALYIVFSIRPYRKRIARSILKEPKIYFFDTGAIKDNGARLENAVALHLYAYSLQRSDLSGKNYRLHFLRTKDGKEADFCLSCDNEAFAIFEVKNRDSAWSGNLIYFKERYNIPAVQLVKDLRIEKDSDNISMRECEAFLSRLNPQSDWNDIID